MEKRKNVKIKEADWAYYKQLALNKRMTLQEEIDDVLEAFKGCVEDSKTIREEKK